MRESIEEFSNEEVEFEGVTEMHNKWVYSV